MQFSFVTIALLATAAVAAPAENLQTRQIGGIGCNISRAKIVGDLSSAGKAVEEMQAAADPSDQQAQAAISQCQQGLDAANGGIRNIAQTIVTGGNANAADRDAVLNGLNQMMAALGDLTGSGGGQAGGQADQQNNNNNGNQNNGNQNNGNGGNQNGGNQNNGNRGNQNGGNQNQNGNGNFKRQTQNQALASAASKCTDIVNSALQNGADVVSKCSSNGGAGGSAGAAGSAAGGGGSGLGGLIGGLTGLAGGGGSGAGGALGGLGGLLGGLTSIF